MVAAKQPPTQSASTEWTSAIEGLRAAHRGPLLLPGEATYEVARKVFNEMIDRHPRLILQPLGTADVVQALKFARDHRLVVSVKGGGHNVAGNAVCNDGVVLDMVRMKGIHVEPKDRTAWVEACVTWAELDRETQVHALAVPGGRVTSTGVAGFTLGGGIGWMSREHGLACDNLVAVDLVTADGRAIRASAVEHPDLFWAIRGGGGSLGIVTAFEFELHPLGPMIYGGLIAFPGEQASKVLPGLATILANGPPQLSSVAILLTAPPAPFIDPKYHGQHLIGVAVFYSGPASNGERIVRSIRDLGTPVVEQVGPVEYVHFQAMFDAFNPPGLLNYWKSQYMPELSAETISAVLDRWDRSPSPLSEIHFEFLGGAIGEVDEEASAYSNRRAPILLNHVAKWTDPKDSDANVRWIRDLWDATAAHSTGGIYLNFLGDSTAEVVRAAYSAGKFERLQQLKASVDPENMIVGNSASKAARP